METKNNRPLVGIIMDSNTDLPVMQDAAKISGVKYTSMINCARDLKE